MKSKPLTEATLDEIEQLAKSNAAETYRGALLALIEEVRRLLTILNAMVRARTDWQEAVT